MWTLQGVWVVVTSLPVILLLRRPREAQPNLGLMDGIGAALWGIGFLLELVADLQKLYFRSLPANKSRFLDTGLWRHSRHPNYAGEICLWAGMSLLCSVGLRTWAELAACIASPLFVHLLLTRVSGLPLLEKHAERTWGKEPAYQKYVRTTPILVPFIGRCGQFSV